jgi:hypothetical protein
VNQELARNPDDLVKVRAVRSMFGGCCNMTVFRWVKKGLPPKPVKINGLNHWRYGSLEEARSVLMNGARRVSVKKSAGRASK